jgi:cell division protein FtsB
MKKTASRILKVVGNKYMIALITFLLMMLFFDDNNLFLQLDRKRQLNALLKSKAFYESEIANTRQTLNNLESSPASVEKFARENFLMKRDNEDIFIVDTLANKNK